MYLYLYLFLSLCIFVWHLKSKASCSHNFRGPFAIYFGFLLSELIFKKLLNEPQQMGNKRQTSFVCFVSVVLHDYAMQQVASCCHHKSVNRIELSRTEMFNLKV